MIIYEDLKDWEWFEIFSNCGKAENAQSKHKYNF